MSYRVIQWATGNVGLSSLRAVARHPELELVGVLVRDPAKAGLDAGWISNGLAATAMHGVHALPHVCRAEPGIRTFLDLPLITGRHTVPV